MHHAVAGTQGHSPSRRYADDDADADGTREPRRQVEHMERQVSVNPIMLVGKGLHAGVASLQEVPQQAIGHMMGGVHRSQRRLAAKVTAEPAGSSPHKAAGHSPHRQASAKSPQRRRRRQAAAAKRNNNAAAAAVNDAPEALGTDRQVGSDHPESDGSAGVHPQDQSNDSSDLKGWDKVRKVVRGTPMLKSRGDIDERSVPSLASSSPAPEGNPETRQLKRDSSSGGSLSKNTTGPMQYLWSRGGKMAAVLAMMGSRGNNTSESNEGDIPETHVSHRNEPCDVTSRGAANAPGDDVVSQAGARDPQESAGAQASSSSGEEDNAEQSKDSATRNDYAADIIRRGLNKEGWKLVITGHSLGAGTAALIALKLKDRFPAVKCWAFCPPGGLLTPNMAHSMKPFCTSVVVNKDAIPRMSLKNLNRFMEGKLMALACSRLNAFQIFWGSYGKVNRRRFFDEEIFRPISEMPEEAREMLERFQECTLTDVSAQDMVPPGRVMYLRRFKASPNACPIKQEEHWQRARAHKYLHTPNMSNLRRRLSTSSGDSSGSESTLSKLKQRLSSSSSDEGEPSCHQEAGDGSGNREQAGDESGPRQEAGHPQQHLSKSDAHQSQHSKCDPVEPGSDPQQESESEHSQRYFQQQQQQDEQLPQRQGRSLLQVQDDRHTNGQLQSGPEAGNQMKHAVSLQQASGHDQHDPYSQKQRQDECPGQGLSQADDQNQHDLEDQDQDLDDLDEEAEYYRQAGLQKPKGPLQGVGLGAASGWASRRRKKKTLHASLQNPKDLFWDAVWIEPEDIIREGLLVSPKMTEDHYTTSLLTSLKAVSERLASQEGKSGKETTQGSTRVTAADKKDNSNGQGKSKNQSGGMKEAALGGVFDLV